MHIHRNRDLNAAAKGSPGLLETIFEKEREIYIYLYMCDFWLKGVWKDHSYICSPGSFSFTVGHAGDQFVIPILWEIRTEVNLCLVWVSKIESQMVNIYI